ncbi:MAG: 50S ribosomal protein L6 [Saprospiraceae bacterium]|nr:50S ribosomal protein L6 [Saprospiraceae bacterium]
MSRIGKAPIQLPDGVSIDVTKGNLVTVKGAKGTLTQQVDPDIKLNIEDGVLTLVRPTDSIRHRSFHGLYRSLINNMVTGVSQGFAKELELVGVGFRGTSTGNLLELSLGFSHPIYFYIPDELTVETTAEKGKNPTIKLAGIDKQLLGQVAAKIRAFRKPEPYKGKGVKYKGELIRRKVGKSGGK